MQATANGGGDGGGNAPGAETGGFTDEADTDTDGFASGADGTTATGGCTEPPGTKAVINITVPLSALLGLGFAFKNETDANTPGATVPGAAGVAGPTGSTPDSGPGSGSEAGPDPGGGGDGDATATDPTTASNTGPGSTGNPGYAGGPVSSGLAVTEDGNVLALSAVRAMAPNAQIRRLIFDERTGLPLDLGRAHRLAPGYLRSAAFMGHTTCAWGGGCDVPVSQCEADHITEFTRGGATSAANLQPLCSKHNRLKYRHSRTENTPKGAGATADNG